MKFSELRPGKYLARIKDWGLEEVVKLGGKMKVVIQFDILVLEPTNEYVAGRWEGFLENKDGLPNKKTIKTIVTCGFTGFDPSLLDKTNALNNDIDYEVTVIKDGEYTKIDWVNLPGSGGVGIKKAKLTKRASQEMKMAFDDAQKELGVPKVRVKNYAPGSADDDLPF